MCTEQKQQPSQVVHLTVLTPHTHFSFSSFIAASWFAASSCWRFSIASFCKLTFGFFFYFKGILFLSGLLLEPCSSLFHRKCTISNLLRYSEEKPPAIPTSAHWLTFIFSPNDVRCETFAYQTKLSNKLLEKKIQIIAQVITWPWSYRNLDNIDKLIHSSKLTCFLKGFDKVFVKPFTIAVQAYYM